jgi:hypothetical protein
MAADYLETPPLSHSLDAREGCAASFVLMSSLYDALADVTIADTDVRMRYFEGVWMMLPAPKRAYALVDLGMRLGMLTATSNNRIAVDGLTMRFRRLESAFLRSL